MKEVVSAWAEQSSCPHGQGGNSKESLEGYRSITPSGRAEVTLERRLFGRGELKAKEGLLEVVGEAGDGVTSFDVFLRCDLVRGGWYSIISVVIVTRGVFFFALLTDMVEADLFLPFCAFVELFNTLAGIFLSSSLSKTDDFRVRRFLYGPSLWEDFAPDEDSSDEDIDRRRARARSAIGTDRGCGKAFFWYLGDFRLFSAFKATDLPMTDELVQPGAERGRRSASLLQSNCK